MSDNVYRYEISYTDKKKTTFTYYVFTRHDMQETIKLIEARGYRAKTRYRKLAGFRQKELKKAAI